MLDRAGFRTFKDDEKLQRGKCISTELLYYINHSKIAVIVFSTNYSNSSWCLDELVEIMEGMRSKGQIMVPIFYHVKPSQVRKPKSSCCLEAFAYLFHYQEREKVESRRDALKKAASISGLDLEDSANGDEGKFIKQIVRTISEKLQPKPFRAAEYEVGIRERASEIIKLLEDDDEALFLGICGIGGAGKTTLAKAVFNSEYKKFERSCFLENVREESKTSGGLAKLQCELLREILMDETIKIVHPDRGINVIKDRLRNKKLLIVLDDVDDDKISENLFGVGHEWVKSGSKIIITTRNKRVLEKRRVKTYDIPLLDDNEALQLFSWHAFKQKQPEDDYVELSHRAKHYAQGLPLALQVLGSTFCERSKQEWLALLVRLENNPPKEIDDVLKISYDVLGQEEKDIFLDIACYFKGDHIEYVKNIYKINELDPVIGIKFLCERCLISITEYNYLSMHDLIQEMGRNIVRQESEDPGQRSRLWTYDDIYQVFTYNTVTEKIQAIMLPKKVSSSDAVDFLEEGFHVRAKAFKNMRKLRILQINGVQLDGCLTHLSNELRYIEWDGYPREYLPHCFHPKKFVQLHLPNSLIKGIETNSNLVKMLKVLDLQYCKYPVKNPFFRGFPCLEELTLEGCNSLVEVHFEDMKLKKVNLSFCENLKQTPNLSGLPCLEELRLEGCTSVVEVHRSIEFHERLVHLDLTDCNNLKHLATRINLRSLQILDLEGCSKLEKFPDLQVNVEGLKDLCLTGTAIKELPPSVAKHLKGLRELFLCGKMFERLPDNMGEMKSLEELHLDGSGIKEIPSSIAQLTHLRKLDLRNCNLDEEAIQNLPHSLVELDLSGNIFASLPESFTHLTNLTRLTLDDYLSLQTLDSLPSSLKQYSIPTAEHNSFSSLQLDLKGSRQLAENIPNIYNSQSQLHENIRIVFMGNDIPSWFSHRYEREDMSNWVTLRMDHPNSFPYLKQVCVCAVITIKDQDENISNFWRQTCELKVEINGSHVGSFRRWIERYETDHIMFMRCIYKVDRECNSDGYCIKASFKGFNNERLVKVKKWGIHPVMEGHKPYM